MWVGSETPSLDCRDSTQLPAGCVLLTASVVGSNPEEYAETIVSLEEIYGQAVALL